MTTVTVKLDADQKQKLKEIAAFMEDCGVSEITEEVLVRIALNEFHRSFSRQGNFKEFLGNYEETLKERKEEINVC